MSLRLGEWCGRLRLPLSIALQLTIEIEGGTHQQLLETVVQCLGQLFPRMLFRERKVGRQLTQLDRALLQFDRTFLQRRLGGAAGGDVRDERDRVPTTRRRDVIQTDLERKRRPVLSLTNQIESYPHRTGTR